MLQTAASAWHDDDVAAAVGELLYRAMELAGDVGIVIARFLRRVLATFLSFEPPGFFVLLSLLAFTLFLTFL